MTMSRRRLTRRRGTRRNTSQRTSSNRRHVGLPSGSVRNPLPDAVIGTSHISRAIAGAGNVARFLIPCAFGVSNDKHCEDRPSHNHEISVHNRPQRPGNHNAILLSLDFGKSNLPSLGIIFGPDERCPRDLVRYRYGRRRGGVHDPRQITLSRVDLGCVY